jgi:hypothetical protein
MAKKMFFVGTLGAALAVLIAGCDLSGLINNANGGGGFDNALVGTWHLSRTDADNGRDAAFTFTSDGRLTGSPGVRRQCRHVGRAHQRDCRWS